MPDFKGQPAGRCRARKRQNIPVYSTTRLLVHLRVKEEDSILWKSAVHSRSETALYKPESCGERESTRGQSTHGQFPCGEPHSEMASG